MNLSLVDGEVNALENFLLRFGNHGRKVFDLEEELLLGLTPRSLRRRIDGGGEASVERRERAAAVVWARTADEGARGGERK